MGGRAAEELIYGEFNSGASNDLKVATQRAHSMVCEWGMSELGPIAFGGGDEVFLGRDFSKTRDYSDETAAAVDREVHRLLEEAYRDAKDLLEKHVDVLKALGDELFERETLDALEVDAIIRRVGGEDLIPPLPESTDEPEKEQPDEEPPAADTTEDGSKNDDSSDPVPPGDIVPDTV